MEMCLDIADWLSRCKYGPTEVVCASHMVSLF